MKRYEQDLVVNPLFLMALEVDVRQFIDRPQTLSRLAISTYTKGSIDRSSESDLAASGQLRINYRPSWAPGVTSSVLVSAIKEVPSIFRLTGMALAKDGDEGRRVVFDDVPGEDGHSLQIRRNERTTSYPLSLEARKFKAAKTAAFFAANDCFDDFRSQSL